MLQSSAPEYRAGTRGPSATVISPNLFPKDIANAFFRLVSPDSNIFVCECGLRRNRNKSSYTNLVSHVRAEHPDFAEVIVQLQKEDRSNL